jgi:hypothetical protein
MYNTEALYHMIYDELRGNIDFNDYESGDELNEVLLDFENDVKNDILNNNEFSWYDDNGREYLIDAVQMYEGGSFKKLAEALTDINLTRYLIFILYYDEVCNDILDNYVKFRIEKNNTEE